MKKLWVSASQIETFRLCPRKWWLSKVRKLPEAPSTSTVFGTVLHAVAERYLSADDLGRDLTGKPVELFPSGWTQARNQFNKEIDGEISPEQAALIRDTLIPKAIEAGVLQRLPNRLIEYRFEEMIETNEGPAMMMGFVDCLHPDMIQDHKTTKATRWMQSPDSLRKNTQMLIYAHAATEAVRNDGHFPVPDLVTLRHNQYCTDPMNPVVRKTETQVNQDQIQSHWKRVLTDIEAMIRYRARAEKWSDLPDPADMSRACNAYGGCPFVPICTGKETEARYEGRYQERVEQAAAVARLTSHLGTSLKLNVLPSGGEEKDTTTMSKFQEMLEKKKAAAAAAKAAAATPEAAPETPAPVEAKAPEPEVVEEKQIPAPVAKPTPTPTPPPAPEAPMTIGHASDDDEGFTLPPWVDPASPSNINHGCGFNVTGQPDAISKMKAKEKGLPGPDLFEIEVQGDGVVSWSGREDTRAAGMDGVTRYRPSKEVKVQEREDKPVAEAPKQEPESVSERGKQIAADAPVAAPKPKAEPHFTGNAPADNTAESPFALCINVAVLGTPYTDLNKMVEEQRQGLADANGFQSYWHLNAFERRDAMAQWAEELAPKLAGLVVVLGVNKGNHDLGVVVEVLQSKASGGLILPLDI